MRFKLLVGSALFALSCSRGDRTRTACNAPSDVSAQYLAIIRITLASTYQRMAFRLPSVSPKGVYLVSDPAVCARVGQVMGGKHKPGQPPYTSLYVYQIGTSYAVIDRYTGGDYDGIYYFDPN
jgi:hypothetical protein